MCVNIQPGFGYMGDMLEVSSEVTCEGFYEDVRGPIEKFSGYLQ